MTAPALRIPVSADVSKFQQDMEKTSSIATKATLAITKQAVEMSAAFLASQGAVGATTLALGRMIPVVGQVVLAYKAIGAVFGLMGHATELAEARIAEFNKIAAEANESGFSTQFFQRVVKGAEGSTVKVNDLTEALKRFNTAITNKLGGSDLQQRLTELQKAGNFSGAAIGGSDSEARLRSTVALIKQALDSGQRLAAIDLATTAFGPKVAAALRADSGYLDEMLKRADAINKTQLISDADLGRAIELKQRMDEAHKILAEKWKPVQQDLGSLGMNYKENWVSITETIAAAVGYATSLYTALGKVPEWFAKGGNASFWKNLTDATERMGLNSAPEGLVTDKAGIEKGGQTDKLRAALQNYANVTKSMREASDVQSSVRGDTSRAPKKEAEQTADAYDRATESIEKHIARLGADAQAVSLGAAAQAQLRAEATLTTAAMQAYGKVSADTAADITEMAKRTGEAAAALEKAKVASAIEFGQKTAFLTNEDVNIARTLAGVYGNDVEAALRSSDAEAMRFEVKQ